ncbi:hypothetical protein C7974DRAFT_396573 [Boeremia exigua]|uniref:uncharacterized protein n=1 Tax=Boeremia exigua TaxID=749465 RepID=UPI001E8D56CA|nr:uncharacterized protein C7974DRAFT_396573 [Boeremia exigua]KAH6625702.1 hypothetical protein C7974DRAFT_396573 [Boeremia exigua]
MGSRYRGDGAVGVWPRAKTVGGLRACGFGVWGALLVRWVCCLELSATVTRPGQTIDGLANRVFKLVAPRCVSRHPVLSYTCTAQM